MANASRTLPFDRPHPLALPREYSELRASEPVAAVTAEDGGPAWLVTSHEAASAVLGDARFGVTPLGAAQGEGATLLTDGEPHARLRKLIGKTFTARRIETLRPRVEKLAGNLAGSLARKDGRGDLVDDYAAPLSIGVISELLGVAIEDRETFRALADSASAADFTAADSDLEAAQHAWAAFGEFVGSLVVAKRSNLGDDLLSDLINAHDTDAERLNDYELTTLALTIMASGYLTATNAIAVGTLLLLNEGLLDSVAAGSGEANETVEEIIRLQIALIGEVFPRWAHADIEVAGVTIRKGDRVLVRLGAANRDPARFAEPDAFRPGRATGHLAFGRGAHHCLGAALARLEIGVALRALARNLPGLALDGNIHDIQWSRSHADAGPIAVPVTW